VWSLLDQSEVQDFSTPVVLAQDLDQSELVNLQALGASSTIKIQSDFERYYPNGPIFSSVVGYVGRVSENDLANNSKLTADDFVGKMGIEEEYGIAGNTGRGYQIHRCVWESIGRRATIRFHHWRLGAPND
jgi:cell division protein FtsI/penicillin-binding protein 2